MLLERANLRGFAIRAGGGVERRSPAAVDDALALARVQSLFIQTPLLLERRLRVRSALRGVAHHTLTEGAREEVLVVRGGGGGLRFLRVL